MNYKKIDPVLIDQLKNFSSEKQIRIMEVCGTHTVAIHRFGIHKLLPECVKLVSGPGCPVCVTPDSYIDEAVFLARSGCKITTFGDMIKVPGSKTNPEDSTRCSLDRERAAGNDIKIVYSPMDALKIAENTDKEVVFLSVGFETTIPGIAVTVKKAKEKNITNFSVLTSNKIVPPALSALIDDQSMIDGFLLPGHVSTVLGRTGYSFMEKLKVSSVIAGFDPLDLVSSILLLLSLIKKEDYTVVNNYQRAVREDGNPVARKIIDEIFRADEVEWRGIGVIPGSGLSLRDEYKAWDARHKFDIKIDNVYDNTGCRCGEVLKGLIDPPECQMFRKICHPDNPVGPCMVSQEGSCSAWYWYG